MSWSSCQVHDVHGRSTCDSLSRCSVATRRRLPSLFVVAPASSALCPSRRVSNMTLRISGFHVVTTSSGSQTVTDRKTSFFYVILSSCTCVQVSHDFHPSGTDGDRRRAVNRPSRHRRQHGWTWPQPFFLQCGSKVHDVFAGFVRMLGNVHDRQPSVILIFITMKKLNAWICAPPTTDPDHASVIPDKKRELVSTVFLLT